MMSDLKFGLRTLTKAPGFTVVAIATLALAIGVNTALFSLINGLVLRPLVAVHPEQVVNVFTAKRAANRDYRSFSYEEYQALKSAKDVFADVAAVQFALAGIGEAQGLRRSFAFLVSEDYFALLGAAPVAGRFFTADECRPNARQLVVVASFGYWQRMGGRADFVGSTIRVNGRPYTVVGVAPKHFSGLNAVIAPEIWAPLGAFTDFGGAFADTGLSDLANSRNYILNITARLADGVTLDNAKARLGGLEKTLTSIQPADAATPTAERQRELQIERPSRFSISTSPSGDGSMTFLVVAVFSMGGCVILVAAMNLANMLLARGTARAREMAVRVAVGASRWQIVRQLLIEGFLLALGGGGLGLLMSLWANDLLLQSLGTLFSAMNFSIAVELRPDLTVMLVTLGICGVTTILFSLGPALAATRVNLVEGLKQQSGDPAIAGRFNRFFAPRHCLVMGQIALSAMLLFSAALFYRGARKAAGVDLGFETKGGLVAQMDFTLANTTPDVAKPKLFAALDRVRSSPGVRDVAVSTMMPYGSLTNLTRVVPVGASLATGKGDAGESALYTAVTDGYFRTIGVRLLQGRDFTEQEARTKGGPKVAILDEAMAKKFFPKGNALGQRIRYTQPPADGSPAEMEIVGICSGHRHDVFETENRSRVFVPYGQAFNGMVLVHIRLASEDPETVAAHVATFHRFFRELDPDLPVLEILPFATAVAKSIELWIVRLGAVLFGIFGAVALTLAVVGVYGVRAYAVARRTREIGIRMALGARPRDVFALVMRQGVLQTVAGLCAGALLCLGAGQLLGKLLYQVSPHDPVALFVAAGLLSAAALLATFLPARRAAHVSPMTALRAE